jgi:eukaryotic-like serine/threonine-protein kinase
MTEAAPQKIGKYEIVELVGEGAMGTVYRAKDTVLGRTVAIKVMNASIARQQDHRQRFLREAQAAGSLQHPNVVTIYDMGELDGHLFIAMEFVHGIDLEKLMVGAEPLKLQSKLDIIVDVLMGLSYAHKHGIVHRDIKPANIRVEDDGRAKIMDFGVAHLASSDMTRTGLVVGTPSYMAPEQVMGGKAVAGTDLFAVGAVLYHLLTGQKPFEGPTLQSLFYRIVTDMPKPLEEVRPGLPPRLNDVIQKAMAKEASDRYLTALEMANDIISVRSELSGNAYASTASLESAVTLVQSYAPKPVPVVGQEKKLPWKPIGGGAAVAAVVLIGWFAFARGDGSERVLSTTVDTSSKTPAVAVATDTPAIVAESAGSKKSLPAPPVKEAAVVPAPPVTKKKPDQSAIARTKERLRQALQSSQKKAAAPTQAPPPRIVTPPAPVVVAAPQNTVTAPPASAPVVKAPEPQPVARPAPREEIASVVAAYARAIESRDISAVRRAYPGITGDQARGFQQFFQSTRSINATFRVADIDVSGNSADAHLSGSYEYVTNEGRTERQPVSFSASLHYDGSSWRLTSVR